MASSRELVDRLLADAIRRKLTPKAWWLGADRYNIALSELSGDPHARIEAGRVVAIHGLPVKLLRESPRRLALWCAEGALDL